MLLGWIGNSKKFVGALLGFFVGFSSLCVDLHCKPWEPYRNAEQIPMLLWTCKLKKKIQKLRLKKKSRVQDITVNSSRPVPWNKTQTTARYDQGRAPLCSRMVTWLWDPSSASFCITLTRAVFSIKNGWFEEQRVQKKTSDATIRKTWHMIGKKVNEGTVAWLSRRLPWRSVGTRGCGWGPPHTNLWRSYPIDAHYFMWVTDCYTCFETILHFIDNTKIMVAFFI